MTYILYVLFEGDDLEAIAAAGQAVVLVKSLVYQDPANVAWVSFSPFSSNTLTWEDTYGLYASTSPVADGTIVSINSSVTGAQSRYRYIFENSATFSGLQEDASLSEGQFAIDNQYGDLTFGMLQSIVVNNQRKDDSPINAETVLFNQSAVYEPLETVTVFLSSYIESGQVTSTPSYTTEKSQAAVTGKPIVVTYQDGVTEITIQYDGTTGSFLEVSSS